MIGCAVMRRVVAGVRFGLLLVLVAGLDAQDAQRPVDWPAYAGDAGATHFSPLADINRANVNRLAVAWSFKPNEGPLKEFGTQPGNFQNTPLMIDNVVYLSTPYNRVVALEARTGRELWRFDPEPFKDGQPPNGTGFVHRGVAAWRDGNGSLRIFMNSRYRLIALDAESGKPVSSFGRGGEIDLTDGLVWKINPRHYTNTSPPIVYKDLIILGNGVGDRLTYRNDPPGDVRAFDARTGKLVWTFHTIPQAGEFGNDTWGGDSWKFTGHTNVWAPMSLDDQRGLLYLPVTTPSNDYYGARRPGQNLFAESIVCLDALTGTRKWHFQVVHHGLWDYDLPAAPILATITVAGAASTPWCNSRNKVLCLCSIASRANRCGRSKNAPCHRATCRENRPGKRNRSQPGHQRLPSRASRSKMRLISRRNCARRRALNWASTDLGRSTRRRRCKGPSCAQASLAVPIGVAARSTGGRGCCM